MREGAGFGPAGVDVPAVDAVGQVENSGSIPTSPFSVPATLAV